MNDELDSLMERASVALARMEYLACEALCREALALAREAGDWAYYARILLPLQEARRQRRLIAGEGTIRLGTADLATGSLNDWLDRVGQGCIVITPPHTPEQARQLDALARQQQRYVEVLYAEETTADGQDWQLRSFAGPEVRCDVAAPPTAWRHRDISRLAAERSGAQRRQDKETRRQGDKEKEEQSPDRQTAKSPNPTPWFLHASEALGDAAIRQVAEPLGSVARVTALEAMLQVVVDHELLHQRLWDAARAVGEGSRV